MPADSNPATARFALSPEDRETFYAAQRRNRRATWRLSLLCVIAAVIMGLPLTLILTPLFYFLMMVAAEIINQASPLPTAFWETMHTLARQAAALSQNLSNSRPVDPNLLISGLLVLFVPGIMFSLAVWIGVRALFRSGGIGGGLLAMQAREPDQRNLKELQLADAAQEMAIAAGLPAPRVLLIEADAANAAAIGSSPNDACIVVTRRLLDDLNREELQAVLANLIGSIGNGDLSIAFTVASVFESCGMLVTLINAPFGPKARGALWNILKYVFRRDPGGTRGAAADTVAALLCRNLELGHDDIEQLFDSGRKPNIFLKLVRLVFYPILWTDIAVQLTLWMFVSMMLGPCIALLWRTRQYLADASAIQLTRNPDSLASALEKMEQDRGPLPGTSWAAHLFVVGPGSSPSRSLPPRDQMQPAAAAWTKMGGNVPASVMSGAALSASDMQQLRTEMISTVRAASQGDAQARARMMMFSHFMASQRHETAKPASSTSSEGIQANSILPFHPPLKRRLKHLQRMGAHVSADAIGKTSVALRVFTLVLWLIIGPLLAVAAVLMLVVIAMVIMLNLMLMAVWLAAIHGLFGLLGTP
jgi:Zn-dependent protease with chaperone function